MTPPTAEQRRLYQSIVRETAWASAQGVTRPRLDEEGLLVDWLRDTRAELMESEFHREHETYTDATGLEVYCTKCGRKSNWDPGHLFTPEQWRQAADELYREG